MRVREKTYEELKSENERLEARHKAEAKTIASLSDQLQERPSEHGRQGGTRTCWG